MAHETIPDSRFRPFPRAYWVVPGKLLAGCYPGSLNREKSYRKLNSLLECGIRHFINLMEPGEFNWDGSPFVPYEEQLKSMAGTTGNAVTFERLPIKDTWIPPRKEMIHILDHIDNRIGAGSPVYIHCWGGRGRTGTVVGCYLARHGMVSGNRVLKRIQELRQETEDAYMASPETSSQVDLVLSWVEGE